MLFANPKPKILLPFLIFSCNLFTFTTSTFHNQNKTDSVPDSITESDKDEFLAAHNRARLHKGEPIFVWDINLALYASQYANQRTNDCKLKHSGGPHGENIFWGSGNQWTAKDAVRLWVKEHRYYNRQSNTCESGKMCGHYTQIVWRNSLKLGCAKVQCNNGDTFVICSYDPPGNYIGERP